MERPDPIVIVGAGPVGLFTALALHRRGRAFVLLDGRTEVPQDPRATTLQPGALELLEDLGVLDELWARGRVVHKLEYRRASDGELLTELGYNLIAELTRCPYRLHISQWEICQVLIDALPEGSVQWEQRVRTVKDVGDHVEVELANNKVLKASVLVGADGLNSVVRKAAGIDNEKGIKASFFTCSTGPSFHDQLPGKVGDCAYLFSGEDWVLVMRMKGSTRFLFRIPRGMKPAEAMGDEVLRRWTRRLLGSPKDLSAAHLRNRAAYTVQQRLAHTLRKGRLLLAGDSAHSAFPVGGMAMNAGLIDAHQCVNALLDGSEQALATYGAERRAALREGMLADISMTYRTLSARGPIQQWSRGRELKRLMRDAKAGAQHLAKISML